MTRLIFGILTAFLAWGIAGMPASAADYVIDPSHTRVEYRVSHLGFSFMPGRFSDVTGNIAFDPQKPEESQVNVLINALAVSMDDKTLDEKLKGPQFFNASKYPLIAFKSTEVKKNGINTGTMTGDVTLLGVTKPITLKVKFNKKGWNKYAGAEAVGFTAWGKLRRSDFGMKAYIPDVGDEVTLRIAVEATQARIKDTADKAAEIKIFPAKEGVTGGVIVPIKPFDKVQRPEDAEIKPNR